MKNYMFRIGGIDSPIYTRISCRKARKFHKNGQTVVLCPVNLRPFSMWHPEVVIPESADFDGFVSVFETYNCVNQETGRYAAYYADCS